MSDEHLSLSVKSFTTFGDLLRYLRERAKLTQRELAAHVGYHHSYVSYLEKNLRVPDEASLLGRFVPALGLEDEPQLVARLLELAAENQKRSVIPTSNTKPSAEAGTPSLPISLTSLVGRVEESASLDQMLKRIDIRLVSVIGPPGVGKTRLALHVAEQAQHQFADGAAFVDITSVNQDELVLPAIAAALAIPESGIDHLSNSLRNKNLLLVIDNFEQVIEAAPHLTHLLSNAPRLKMLVTSREALRVRGEYEFHLSPLPVTGDPLESPAVQLFIERAQAIKPDFKSDQENISRAAEICRRLDGLPLAIELAAARTGTLSLAAMLEQFDHRFEWLTRGGRDLPVWRQTLWGAVNWSYALLSVQERALFSRLAVFSGGWTLEAAQSVCSDDTLCTSSDIFNLLMQLVDKSLVIAEPELGRYSFLETLREFAFEKLKESGDLDRTRQLHCAYFLNFAQTVRPHLHQGTDQPRWLNLMESEHSNLRNALTWSTETPNRAQTAMELGYAVHIFWQTRSYISEARRWLGQILVLDPAPTPLRADLLRYASDYASIQGDLDQAQRYEEEGLEIARRLEDEEGIYYSLDGIAMLEGRRGNYERAAELLEEVLNHRRQTNNLSRLTTTLNNLAIASRRLNRLERAKQLYTEAISIAEEMKNLNSLSHALLGLAEVYIAQKEYEKALPLQRRSLSIRHELGVLKGIVFSLNSLSVSACHLGRYSLSTQLESASAKLGREIGLVLSPSAQADNDELIALLKHQLGDEQFVSLWQKGQSASLEEIIALAMME